MKQKRNLNSRVYNRTNKEEGWFHSKKGYSIRFNWMRGGFMWLLGEEGYSINDLGHKVKFNKLIWDYVREYPARIIAMVKNRFNVDLTGDNYETLIFFFLDSGLIQIQNGTFWDLPIYQRNNVIMFAELVRDYFNANHDRG